MTYALGRILEAHDKPAVRRIVADAAADDYRFSSFVLGHREQRCRFACRRSARQTTEER